MENLIRISKRRRLEFPKNTVGSRTDIVTWCHHFLIFWHILSIWNPNRDAFLWFTVSKKMSQSFNELAKLLPYFSFGSWRCSNLLDIVRHRKA